MKKFKLKLRKISISKNTEKNILPLKHDRYLARVHTLIGSAIGFTITLILFYIAGLLEEFFTIRDKDIFFIFILVLAITITITLATYLNWKTVRIETVEDIIELYENKKSKQKTI